MRCDQWGRPTCPYCGNPMTIVTRAQIKGEVATECENCEMTYVVPLPPRPPQRGGGLAA